MPRWWPGVVRMEGVQEDRFTQVFVTKKGRPVRDRFPSARLAASGRRGLAPGPPLLGAGHPRDAV